MDPQAILLAEAACRRLCLAYGRGVDMYDDEAVLAVFAADAEWQRPGEPLLRGQPDIRRFLAGRDRSVLMRHVMSNFLVEVRDAQHARGVSYWTGYVAHGQAPGTVATARAPFSVGEYQDEFVRGPQGWRIARRTTQYVFRG